MKYVLALIVMSFITPIKTKTHIVPADIYIPVVKSYTDSDLNLLARLVYSESPHEIYEGKIAVANVV
jgi:spore germination cell wall hydrolase CwlJ-like protein